MELLYAMREHTKEVTVSEKLTPLYTLITKKWKTEFLELFHKLKSWEIENVGEEQFTKCFTSVANYLENPYVRH